MKVVLKVNVQKLGEVGQVVKVRDGYARNFLVPRGMAVPYTEKTKKAVDHMMKQQKEKVTRKEQQYQALLEQVKGITLNFRKKAGENGKLFGSVTPAEIIEALKEQNVEIDKKYLVIADHINKVGEYDILLKFAQGFEAPFKVVVEAEEIQ